MNIKGCCVMNTDKQVKLKYFDLVRQFVLQQYLQAENTIENKGSCVNMPVNISKILNDSEIKQNAYEIKTFLKVDKCDNLIMEGRKIERLRAVLF